MPESVGSGTLREVGRRIARTAPEEMDLTDPEQERWTAEAASRILASASSPREVEELEVQLIDNGAPVAVGLAAKLASSRMRLLGLSSPTHLSVVVAVYKEHLRMLPREEHPLGEDFLRRKLRQLTWLFEGTVHSWDLTVVDDGCPEGSGEQASNILAAEAGSGEARVLHLREAIEAELPPVRALSSVEESRKGGSIRYGIWEALRVPRATHKVLFTDADLSTHLGQAGLLLGPLSGDGARAAVASRREPTSVVVKRGARNTRGKLFIYLWKRMIPQLRSVVDTQCGFKAFDAEAVQGWTVEALESGFAFDIELLLHVHRKAPGSIVTVPIAWIDSDALSTTTELEPYLDMLKMVARFYRAYLPAAEEGEAFARLVEAMDRPAFDRLVDAVPADIADADPALFDAFNGVTATELAARAGLP